MLVVEGPDGAGKTTLVKRLHEVLGWPVNPRIVNQDTTITEGISLRGWVEDNVAAGFQRRIFDRHRLISEPIYGPLFRNELQDGFDNSGWFSVHWDAFKMLSPIIIYCLPPLEVVRQNLADDRNNREVNPLINQVYWQYWSMMCRDRDSIHHDYTNPPNLTDLVGSILRRTAQGLGAK